MDVCEQVATGVTHEELIAEIHVRGTRLIVWFAVMMMVYALVTVSSFAALLWLFT